MICFSEYLEHRKEGNIFTCQKSKLKSPIIICGFDKSYLISKWAKNFLKRLNDAILGGQYTKQMLICKFSCKKYPQVNSTLKMLSPLNEFGKFFLNAIQMHRYWAALDSFNFSSWYYSFPDLIVRLGPGCWQWQCCAISMIFGIICNLNCWIHSEIQ